MKYNLAIFRPLGAGPWLLFVLGGAGVASAQDVEIPRHVEEYLVESGVHVGARAATRLAFSDIVTATDAPWLKIHFAEWQLTKGSYVLLTSLEDGGQQRLDAWSLPIWSNNSACFNGDSVLFELYVAADDAGASVKIETITVGERGGGQPGSCAWPCGICGGVDDRVSSSDARVGRQFPSICTIWIVSNGALVTAGHCVEISLPTEVHFNVPLSDCDGTANFPPPEDQYPIIQGSIVFRNTGSADDWCVMRCGPNSDTQLTPVQAQGQFFRLAREDFPSQARVTGYGLDGSPAGCNGSTFNQFNFTQQTHVGGLSVNPFNNADMSYDADLSCGSSGGPVHFTTGSVGLGIVSRCNVPFVCNQATGFDNDDLETEVHTAIGSNVEYVDVGHPVVAESGSILRPFSAVTDAINAASSGAIISVVTGSYTAAAGNTFTAGADGRAMTFQAPVGTVTIGN